MKVIIIEDEARAAKRLKSLVQELKPDLEIAFILQSLKESKEWFEVNELPDLIISDIQLGDGRVFEVLETIEALPPVIFTTAYDEFAIKAFKTNGIDYLLKPIDKDELSRAMDKFMNLNTQGSSLDIRQLAAMLKQDKLTFKSRFMIKVGEKLKSVPSDEIACFYSVGGDSYLKTNGLRNYSIDYTLDQLEDLVDPSSFFRINRKVILHYSNIDTIHTWSGSRLKVEPSCAIDEFEDDIVVSRERVKEFKAWLDR
jgi:DNA-binding LytR/AlgR family response regulator